MSERPKGNGVKPKINTETDLRVECKACTRVNNKTLRLEVPSAMAWLFGASKKSKPEVYVSNEVEDGFNIVSTGPPPIIPPRASGGFRSYPSPGPGYPSPGPGYPTPGQGYPTPGPGYPLYPTLPARPTGNYDAPPYLAICPQAPPGYKPAPAHPLDSIPFKLSPSLESMPSPSARKTLSELENIRSRLSQVRNRLHSTEYTYSFELERSILRETCAASN